MEPLRGIEPRGLHYESGPLSQKERHASGLSGQYFYHPTLTASTRPYDWSRHRCLRRLAPGVGIEPTEDALTVRPVLQRTSPGIWRRIGDFASAYHHGGPPRVCCPRRRAVSNFQRPRSSGELLGVPGLGVEPRFAESETADLPLVDPGIFSELVQRDSNPHLTG